jgi:peptidoglycan hydrolase CwlO-like protein
MKMRKVLRPVLSLLVLLGLLLPGIIVSGAQAAPPEGPVIDIPPVELPEKGSPKLESVLWQLSAAWEKGETASFSTQRDIDVVGGGVRVIIEAMPGQALAAATAAEALGFNVEASYDNLVQVVVSVPGLIALAEDPAIRFMRLPYVSVPAVTSEGVNLIDADDWQSAGYTGAGVKVGILDIGFSGYSGLLGTELPDTSTTWWAPSVGDAGTSVHGTACAEIVYDIAPDADFYLANFATSVEWANAIDWLIAQGVDVISSSVGWVNSGPGDGTGIIGDKVDDVRAAGILWSQAAGNYAQKHWMGGWVDTDADNWHEFNPGDESNAIWANAGDTIAVFLKWDDPWGGSGNDYDLYLFDPSMNVVASSLNVQDGNDEPAEGITYSAASTGTHHIAINLLNADGTAEFHLLTFYDDLQYQVASNSLIAPADSPSAMTMGAVWWNGPNVIESFSSQGPTQDGRTKPDLVAPDGVSTAPYGPVNFFGTSSAAPHGAGAAVLVKDRYPSYSPAQIQAFLEEHAVDLGVFGKDNIYGSGRLALPAIISSPLSIDTTVGSIHFRGEVAEFYLQIVFQGEPVAAATVNATLYKPDGTFESLTFILISGAAAESLAFVPLSGSTGLYKAEFNIPADAPIGQYALAVQATYKAESTDAKGTSLDGFLLSATLTGWDAWLVDIRDGVATIQTDVGIIRADITSINASITAIEGNIATIATDIGTLQADVSIINTNITAIEGNIATIATDIGTLQADVSAINASITTIEGNIATIETDIGTLQIDVSTINAEVTSIEGSIATLQTDVGTINISLSSIDARVTEIEDSFATVQTTLGTMSGKVTEIEDGIATIQTDVGTLQDDVGDILNITETTRSRNSYLLIILIVAGIGTVAAVTAAVIAALKRGTKAEVS